MTKPVAAARMNKNAADSEPAMIRIRESCHIIRRDEEENSTDAERYRERTGGGRFLRETFGTGLGVLREERSAAPAITV